MRGRAGAERVVEGWSNLCGHRTARCAIARGFR
jgi:hypothetical protein